MATGDIRLAAKMLLQLILIAAFIFPALAINRVIPLERSIGGTTNSAPVPGTKDYPNGSSRPGPNLYTNSMLALNCNIADTLES